MMGFVYLAIHFARMLRARSQRFDSFAKLSLSLTHSDCCVCKSYLNVQFCRVFGTWRQIAGICRAAFAAASRTPSSSARVPEAIRSAAIVPVSQFLILSLTFSYSFQ